MNMPNTSLKYENLYFYQYRILKSWKEQIEVAEAG